MNNLPDLQSARTALKQLFTAHDYSEFVDEVSIIDIDTFEVQRFDEVHIQSSEQDCDNEDAVVTLYGFIFHGEGFMLVARANLTRGEAWEFGKKHCVELGDARSIGFSCNPNGFASDGWISIRLQMLPRATGDAHA